MRIVVKSRRYRDIFQQPADISSFNFVIAMYAIVVGILDLVAILGECSCISKHFFVSIAKVRFMCKVRLR
jgi:hypothetical protein